MIVRLLVIAATVVLLVNGNCTFQSTSTEDLKLQTQFRNWTVYEKNFNISDSQATYLISICKSLNSTPDAGIVQIENNKIQVLGRLTEANLVAGDNWLLLAYENGDTYQNECANQTRRTSIIFVCGNDPNNIKILQSHTTKSKQCGYAFQMQASELCPKITPEVKKIGGFGIFCIIILCLFTVYFVGGFLIMRFQYGARGIDQIPNLHIWRRLGNLSADACEFCCRCHFGGPRSGYFLDESGPDLRGDVDILAP